MTKTAITVFITTSILFVAAVASGFAPSSPDRAAANGHDGGHVAFENGHDGGHALSANGHDGGHVQFANGHDGGH